MNKDMSISEGTYSLIASMLLIGYVVFQIPGTLLIRKFGPAYQVCKLSNEDSYPIPLLTLLFPVWNRDDIVGYFYYMFSGC